MSTKKDLEYFVKYLYEQIILSDLRDAKLKNVINSYCSIPLKKGIANLPSTPILSDVDLITSEDNKTLKAHKVILASR